LFRRSLKSELGRRAEADHGTGGAVECIAGFGELGKTLDGQVLFVWGKPGVHVTAVRGVLAVQEACPTVIGQDLSNGHQFDSGIYLNG
jgi:hypothetical protein